MLSNNPPSAIEDCESTAKDLGTWLEDHPVILSEDDAREGKLLVDRATLIIADAEAERDKQVRPLNEQVKEINNKYRAPRETLTRISGTLKDRLADYIKAEKARREAEAEEKRRAVEEAEIAAREAEDRERMAREDASHGIVESGVVDASAKADTAFAAYQASVREAARAEKEAEKVKIVGGFRRALSIRTKEVLTLHNWQRAIDEMGLYETLIEAILKEARTYRKNIGHLPSGVVAITEEVI